MLSLIDADIVAFRCAAVSEEEDVEIALIRTHKMMEEIINAVSSSSYRSFISGDNNFRYQIYPEYKANRKDKPKPKHLKDCQNYLVTEWKSEITDGCEADDALGTAQTKDSIICSIDKDLLQIPGKHYNFIKQEFISVEEIEGIRHFYTQLLMGDASDNIPGIAGIGPKKAAKYLEGCETEEEMFDIVRAMYNNDTLMDIYGKCLWIWRHEGNIWEKNLVGKNPSELEMEPQSGCTTLPLVETNQSTVPTTPEVSGFQPVGL